MAAGAQTDLDDLGIAKNAREEKLRAKKKDKAEEGKDAAYHEQMAKLYRQHVLKDPAASQPILQIQGLKKKPTEQTVA